MLFGLTSGFFGGIVLGSFLEHAIHKYLLHSTPKLLRKSKYVKGMWQGHSVSHHGNYMPDDHYTQDETNKEEVLTFKWYEGPLIVIISTSVIFGISALVRYIIGLPFNPIMPEVIGISIAFSLYYIAYESLHAIMHVPKKWMWLRKRRFMVWLNNHHYQHHIDSRTNLNVIIPIADYVWGTKRKLTGDQKYYAQITDKPLAKE